MPKSGDDEIIVKNNEELEILTNSQIREIRQAVEAEIEELESGDNTLRIRSRILELKDYQKALSAIEVRLSTPIPDNVDVDAAIKAATPDPSEDEDEGDGGTDGGTVTDETPPADEDNEADDQVKQLIAAGLEPTNNGNPGTPQATETKEDEPIRPILMASLNPLTGYGDIHNPADFEETSIQAMAETVRRIVKSGTIGQNFTVGRLDLFGGKSHLVPKMKDGDQFGDFNTSIMRGAIDYPEPIQAILCGQDEELDFGDQCVYRTSTPFYNSFGRRVAADACGFKWRKHMSPEDFKDGTAIWDACKQAAVDPDDDSTWKPVTNLPGCEDMYCTAKPFYVTWGLRSSTEDEFCRPEMIAEANRMLGAYRAKRLEEAALYIADKNSRLLAQDLSVYGGLGFRPALTLAIIQALNPVDGKGRLTCPTNHTAYMHRYVLKMLAADMALAGENAGSAEAAVREAFAACGVNSVVFIEDWGCEGQLVDPYEDEVEMVCDFNCDTEDLAAIDCAPMAFGSGEALMPLTDAATIRLIDNDAFASAETGVIDYQFRQDLNNMRQNCGIWFGESRHFLFPTINKDNIRLDLSGICINGNRVDRTAAPDCSVYHAPPSFTEVITIGNAVDEGKPSGAKEGKATEEKVAVAPDGRPAITPAADQVQDSIRS